MNRSTIIASVGIVIFALIIVTTVSVVSSRNELGKVYSLSKEGNVSDFQQMLLEGKVKNGQELPVHDALKALTSE